MKPEFSHRQPPSESVVAPHIEVQKLTFRSADQQSGINEKTVADHIAKINKILDSAERFVGITTPDPESVGQVETRPASQYGEEPSPSTEASCEAPDTVQADTHTTERSTLTWREAAKQQLGDRANQLTTRELSQEWFGDEANRMPWGGRPSEREGMRIIEIYEEPVKPPTTLEIPGEGLIDIPNEQPKPIELEIPVEQDNALRKVLGKVDYTDARESGLLARFEIDPDTKRNGVLHILGGEERDKAGKKTFHGLHLEGAAMEIWSELSGNSNPDISIQTDGTEKMYPMDLYRARQIAVNGVPKTARAIVDGIPTTVPRETTLFPVDYSAFNVLQAVAIAQDNCDPRREYIDHGGSLVRFGSAPTIDGKGQMRIKIIENPRTGKIKAAWPLQHESTPMLMDRDNVMHMITSEGSYISSRR